MKLQSSEDGVKRPYHSPRREAQANETKKVILETATKLFTQLGFRDTTVKQVAELASVSEQTVYNVFDDKVGLLYAVGMLAITGGDSEPAEALEALRVEPDPMTRIRMAAHFTREQWQQGALEIDLMLSNTDSKDPRLAEMAERAVDYKLDINRAFCAVLFPDNIRRSDMTQEEIATFITAVDTGPSITTLLLLGWTMDDYEDWITRLLTLFLEPPG